MNKKIVKILLIILFMVTLCACKTNEKPNKEPDKTPTESEVDNTNQNIDIDLTENESKLDDNSKMAQMLNKLNEYGKEINKTKEYKNYKMKNDMYFISLNELSNKYDVSMFVGEDGTVCDKYNSGLYFRDNNVEEYDNGKNYVEETDTDEVIEIELPYFPILIGCSKEELKR